MTWEREYFRLAINLTCHCWWCGCLTWPWRVRCSDCEDIAANRRDWAIRTMAWLTEVRCFEPEPWHQVEKLMYDNRHWWML